MTHSKNISSITALNPSKLEFVLCDIDDTLTHHGQLHADAYQALWDLHDKGFKIIPVTGRPAGWCEMIARFWPVHGVIGENGGFYYFFEQKIKRYYVQDAATLKANQTQLQQIKNQILKEVPGAAVASDQFCRQIDLAIDFCEDVPRLKPKDIQRIQKIFTEHGAVSKVSSIHINGWFGEHNKLSTFLTYAEKRLNIKDINELNQKTVFIGDSPNDEPMFAYFAQSVGVKNIENFLDQLKNPPRFLCTKEGGMGFVEFTKKLLKS